MGTSLDNSTNGHLFHVHMITLPVTIILHLGEMWMDVFILAVNCRDWMKKKGLSLTDRILILQGIIRISFGCLGMLWHALKELFPWICQRDFVFKVFTASFWYLAACNLWLTASLCSYYCVKIADFRHPFFICLKVRFSGVVWPWLLGAVASSLATSLPYAISELEILGNRNLSHFLRNKNAADIDHKRMASHVIALLGLGCFAAFTICATSATLLLFSLWRHHQRMLDSWADHRTPQSNAHFQAVVIILSLLVNNIIVYVFILLILWNDYNGNPIANVVAVVVLSSCFLMQSLISLCSSRKLRNELCKSFNVVKCRGWAT